MTKGAAGVDVAAVGNHIIEPGKTRMIPTGLAVAIPEGFEIQVRSRSGMASKGIFVTNSPGTIDSDYRGEIGVILTNSTEQPYYITDGERVAQLVVSPVYEPVFEEVEELSTTARGDGGYGSTGV